MPRRRCIGRAWLTTSSLLPRIPDTKRYNWLRTVAPAPRRIAPGSVRAPILATLGVAAFPTTADRPSAIAPAWVGRGRVAAFLRVSTIALVFRNRVTRRLDPRSLGNMTAKVILTENRDEYPRICRRIIAWPDRGHVHWEVRSHLVQQRLRREPHVCRSSTVVSTWNLSW